MTNKTNQFEGGSNGTTLTAGVGGNTGGASGDFFNTVNIVAGGTCVFDNTQSLDGTFSMRQATGATSGQVNVIWTGITGMARAFGRLGIRFSAVPAVARSLCRGRGAAAQNFRIAVDATGHFNLQDSASTVRATSTLVISANTWYRLEFDVAVGASANAHVDIYVGNSTTITETLTANGFNYGTSNIDEMGWGNFASAANLPTIYFDSLDINDVASPGPLNRAGAGEVDSGFYTQLVSLKNVTLAGELDAAFYDVVTATPAAAGAHGELDAAFYSQVIATTTQQPIAGSGGITTQDSRWARLFTTEPPNPNFDLEVCLGQRSATFVFTLIDSITGETKAELHPLMEGRPKLTHSVERTVKRQIDLAFGDVDSQIIDPIRDRILIFMKLANGTTWPLGRYMAVDHTFMPWSAGTLTTLQLTDEMFMLDQQLDRAFTTLPFGASAAVPDLVKKLLIDYPNITLQMETSEYSSVGSWSAGSHRAKVLEDLCLDGDFFPPWFDNHGILRAIRSFDPATKIPTFDLDTAHTTLIGSNAHSHDLLIAPNRIVVVSNGADTEATAASPIYGVYDIPASAPHSIQNRGFVIPEVIDLQIASSDQAQSIAFNIGQRMNICERVQLSTVPDPRHDSWDIVRYRGIQWVEIGWEMELFEGGEMIHTLRKVYI